MKVARPRGTKNELSSDLPTHLLFLGDTRIFQRSPAHPCRIVSHLHLARLYKRCDKRQSFPLIQSATGSRLYIQKPCSQACMCLSLAVQNSHNDERMQVLGTRLTYVTCRLHIKGVHNHTRILEWGRFTHLVLLVSFP